MEKKFLLQERSSQNLLDRLSSDISEKRLQEFINIKDDIPKIEELLLDKENYIPSTRFFKHNDGRVEYIAEEMESNEGKIKFLHEYGHKLMGHQADTFDLENLENEQLAWLYAISSATHLDINIDKNIDDLVEKSLTTYKNHIERRRICFACGSRNTREWAPQQYTCADCFTDL